MTIDSTKLNAFELDALQEVANIGAAHAATALSQILEKKIMISVTRVNLWPVGEIVQKLGRDDDEGIAVHLKVLGEAIGNITFLMKSTDASKLADVLRGQEEPGENTSQLSEEDASALKQTGSILATAYLDAIGRLTKLSMISSVPSLTRGSLGKIFHQVSRDFFKQVKIGLCLETEFIESSHQLKGHFILIPDIKGLESILTALGVTTKEIRS